MGDIFFILPINIRYQNAIAEIGVKSLIAFTLTDGN